MKKLLILVAFITLGINIKAQTSAIKTDLVSNTLRFINGRYEKVLSNSASLQIGASLFIGDNDYDGTAFSASVGYRFYITKKEALRGFYIMPRVGSTFGNLVEVSTNEEQESSSLNFSVNLGYQWIWGSGILIDIGFGPKYYYGFGDKIASKFDGVKPNVFIALGYAF